MLFGLKIIEESGSIVRIEDFFRRVVFLFCSFDVLGIGERSGETVWSSCFSFFDF